MARAGEEEIARRSWWPLSACFVAAAHFASFDLARPIATDIRYYLYFAAQVASGAVPHLDFFDNKTPLAIFAGAGLYRLGGVLGIDPLTAIRVGYLALAAAAGVALFALLRRLAGGRGICGMLGILVYCGFTLLGVMPSIGNIPKLLMALFAGVAALLAGSRRWVLAGAAGWLAFMDWQIGILALAGVFAAALWDPGRRLRALGEAALGTGLAAAPFLVYFGVHGALGPAFRQTVAASFARGSGTLARVGFGERLQNLFQAVDRGCDGHEWLAALAIPGMLILPVWARRLGRGPTLRLVVAAAVYHYGVVAFSLLDFQGYGDLFILLHSLAFFAAVALVEVYGRAAAALRRTRWGAGTSGGVALQTLFLLLAVAALRPSVLHSRFALTTNQVFAGATLEDQRAVHRRLQELVGSRKAAFVGPAELLFLAGDANPLPFVYWNAATHAYFRAGPEEKPPGALSRLVRGSAAEWVVMDRHTGRARWIEGPVPSPLLSSDNGAYAVRPVRLRPGPGP